jgi:hypothetical protein
MSRPIQGLTLPHSPFIYTPRHAFKRLLDLTSKGFEFVSFAPQTSRKIQEVKSVTYLVKGIIQENHFVVAQVKNDVRFIALANLHLPTPPAVVRGIIQRIREYP